MGYKANFFKDSGYWIWISLGGILVLALTDALINIFHGWFADLFVAAVIISLCFYLYNRFQRTRRRDALRKILPVFEAKRTEEIRRMVEADPGFQTFCYRCAHFDQDRRACTLHLHSRKMEIRLHPGDINKYCLYWNVTKESKLLKEVNPEFDGGILG
ncbi:MAG TPA: hypothetical protein VK186_17495 [Candidatus Deferrimicrobium sp.]|nr:hypothetical protein [Candidatus Deferrimicrobium sp.]